MSNIINCTYVLNKLFDSECETCQNPTHSHPSFLKIYPFAIESHCTISAHRHFKKANLVYIIIYREQNTNISFNFCLAIKVPLTCRIQSLHTTDLARLSCPCPPAGLTHYCGVTMGAIASQTTSLIDCFTLLLARHLADLSCFRDVYQPHHCLLNRPFRRRSKKTLKLRVTGLCAGNSPVTGEFPAQKASNAENVSSIWWRHHEITCDVGVSMGNTQMAPIGKLLQTPVCPLVAAHIGPTLSNHTWAQHGQLL